MNSTPIISQRISRREWAAVVAVLLLAFALRTIDLTGVPPGLHNDEVVAAKFAEEVMQGRYAIFFPEDTGSEPLHYYFAAPLMSIFGQSVWAVRLPSIVLSMLAMCVIWALARRLFGPIAALTALAGFAITFWTVAFGRIVLAVVMIVPLGALSAYFFWRAFSAQGRRAVAMWVFAGVWLGMALLAYTAARVIPVVFVAFGVYALVVRRSEWRTWIKAVAITVIVAVIVSAPMFIYLAAHPADDQLGFFDIDRPLRELRQGNLQPVTETSLRALGMFTFVGDPLPYYDLPGRPVLEPIGSILLLIGLIICLWRWRKPEYVFVLLWFFIGLLPSMLSQPAPNYTRTLSTQIVFLIIVGIAVDAWVRRFPNKLTYALVGLIFAGNLVWTVRDYFFVWPSNPEVRFWHQSGLYAVAQNAQRDPDNSPLVVCVPDYLVDERTSWWRPAWWHMHYLLQRPDVDVRFYNCADTMIVPAGPARYAFPDAADDATLQRFPITALLPQADRVELPDRLGTILTVDPAAALDQRLREAAQSPVKYDGSNQAATLPINLGGKVDFLGYALSQAGKDAELVTYWRVKDQLPPQLSQFTHVLNGQGEIITQQDRLMLTSQSLRPGDVFAQFHRLTLPTGLPSGSYPLAIGLYTQPDGKRLPIVSDQQPRGDRILLQELVLK
jgi:4-amino-4-deoxy-L-arabinose transferase-like glycosyltransferase